METNNTEDRTLIFDAVAEAKRPFWVVERYINGRLCYWAAGAKGRSSRDEWSENVDFATRLATFDSSQQILFHTCGGEGRAVQHQMIEPKT
jgi:hypothetical protein